MADTRTKVDALKDLGEKVTGNTLEVGENETIVGMLDKIADNYSGGGSGGSSEEILLNASLEWLSGESIEITDADEMAKLNRFEELSEGNKNVKLGLQLNNSKFYIFITYDGTDEGGALYEGITYINAMSSMYHITLEKDKTLSEEQQTWFIQGTAI